MTLDSPCPCGGATYSGCCARYHLGAEPEDAERLMRSRFSAFAKRDIAYLWRTLHPDHDDRQKTYDAFAAGLSAHFASKPLYKALTVLQATPVDQEGVASVTFRATIRHRGKDASFSERSLFALDGAGWRYIAGSID